MYKNELKHLALILLFSLWLLAKYAIPFPCENGFTKLYQQQKQHEKEIQFFEELLE